MKINKNRESHEYEQNLKKSWKWIKTGKVMKMNKISKSHENEQNLKSHENEQNLKSYGHEQNLKKPWTSTKSKSHENE